MRELEIGATKEILYDSQYKAIPVTIDAEQVTDGNVVPAGTLIYGVGGSVFEDRSRKAEPTTASGDIDGVLQHDVDVTHGDASGSMVYAGTVWANKVQPSVTNNVRTKLNQIKFITE